MTIIELQTKNSKPTNRCPCDYSVEEVAQACQKAIQQHKEGKTIPLNDIKRKIL
jgi:hypothetical protein